MAIKVGRWDCKVCGHKGNLGPKRECEKCGAGRPSDVKFYLPTDAEIVTDEEKIKEANAGADWICEFCNSTNSNLAENCENCGSSKSDSDKRLLIKAFGPNEVPQSFEDYQKEKEKKKKKKKTSNYSPKTVQSIPKIKKTAISKQQKIIYLSLAGFTLLMLILSVALTKEISVKVVEKSWVRTIEIEEYTLLEESDWSVPSDGTLISQSEEIHHYDKVQIGTETVYEDVEVAVGEESYICGQEDMGNGYFKDIYCTETIYETRTESHEEPVYKDVPVYDTYYTYNIWRWVEVEPLEKSGKNSSAVWPIISDNGIFRATDSIGVYKISVEDNKNKEHKEKIEYQEWQIIENNDKLAAKASLIFGFYIGLNKIKIPN